MAVPQPASASLANATPNKGRGEGCLAGKKTLRTYPPPFLGVYPFPSVAITIYICFLPAFLSDRPIALSVNLSVCLPVRPFVRVYLHIIFA